jgi:hypothetical protein
MTSTQSISLHIREALRLIGQTSRKQGLWPDLDNAVSRLNSALKELEANDAEV